jgi:hypothetical protein
MDEGVDPKKMCQGLFDKVARSEQLASVTDPEILILFEDWLEELELEVIRLVKTSGSDAPEKIAEGAGLSRAGAIFILSKLKKEGKIP